jgi:hypothetical protein
MSKKFPTDLTSRGVLKVTDKLLVHNIDTGVTQYTTVNELLDALGIKGQVKFPAIQVPSADVNTLDDYKEGIWTPVLDFGGASVGITYSSQSGIYTKIGSLVFINVLIVLTNKGVSVGDAHITGLPYTSGIHSAGYTRFGNISFADQLMISIASGSATIDFREVTNAGVVTRLNDTDFVNNSYMHINISYRV